MERSDHVFQISGLRVRSKKKKIVQAIQHLGGRYIGGSVYQQESTHIIVPKVLASEKFLAACAAGKWVVHPEYVLDSFKSGSWLKEQLYEVAIRPGTPTVFYPARQWRKRVGCGHTTGAFQGWRVLLIVLDPSRRDVFKRILNAGNAKVYHCPPAPHATITHVLAKSCTDNVTTYNAPCYPLSHIIQHLFGTNCLDMNFKILDDQPAQTMQTNCADMDFSELQTELVKYVTTMEGQTRLFFPEFLSYLGQQHPDSQVAETHFSHVGIMLQCGLFFEALDSIRSSLFPGLFPPAPYLVSLIEYVLKGDASLLFISNFQHVLHSLLINNPQWRISGTVKKYFSKVLQCPQCKRGIWPFLETAISYCMSREDTCHPLPGRALPTLLCFHSDILEFFVKLFQGELHTITNGDSLLCRAMEVPQVSVSNFLLYTTFWTVWERSTLLSQAVKKLVQLVVQALVWEQAIVEDQAEKDMRQSLGLAENLMNIMSILVEFWCHQNIKLNRNLVENGLKDLAEHIAFASYDMSPVVLVELVARISSTRLKLVTTDAIFRKLCCINGISVADEPYSLKNMVSSYLPALLRLGERPRQAVLRGPQPSAEPIAHSWMSPGSVSRIQSSSINETCLRKENVPRGLHRVNAAGETLLHRACKRNHVDTVLKILALPDTDVNVKDHAGWTPLHEACNHGSTACVEALLRHRPAPQLNTQIGGVSPLHDAVLNEHMDIAKMLLQHAGSVLLQQTDGNGCTALDLVSTASQSEVLIQSAKVGDFVPEDQRSAICDPPLMEVGSSLLVHLICAYLREKGLVGRLQPGYEARRLVYKLAKALDTQSLQEVTSGWADQRAVRLVEDVEVVLGLGRGLYLDHMSSIFLGCNGESKHCLMDILENLKAQGEALVASVVNTTE